MKPSSNPEEDYIRYSRAIVGEPLPLALVDLDALEHNIGVLVGPPSRANKTLRVATKSVRSIELLRVIARIGGGAISGFMAFTPREAVYLASQNLDDILVAYPTARLDEVQSVARSVRRGSNITLMVDDPVHIEVAAAAAASEETLISLAIDVDVAYRPFGGAAHVGARRSPLRDATRIASLAERIIAKPRLKFAGLMAYEAHTATVAERAPRRPLMNSVRAFAKRRMQDAVEQTRKEIRAEFARRGIPIPLFNGGGTGTIYSSSADSTLTEVTAGSGFLDSHLFDHFLGVPLLPAAFFALQVTRRPAKGYVTCQGGGFIASGSIGRSKLPIAVLPEGVQLTALEGAGEVQTPLRVRGPRELPLGSPVFFRHAKAGELAEHFLSYLLVRGGRVEGRAATYRGAGQCF